jgi:hypothetical protein
MWPPEEKEPPDMIEARERLEIYRVSVDWLFDMEDYNEWMYEEDYEVNEKGEHKANSTYMNEDEFASCFEKQPKKKLAKRKRSPSPVSTPTKGKRGQPQAKG